MSSPDFAELHGISGTPVAKRCALLSSPAKRELLWFIQAMSLEPGGLRGLAKGLIEMFPERLDAEAAASHDPDTIDAALGAAVSGKASSGLPAPSQADRKARCMKMALGRKGFEDYWSHGPDSMEEFLVDLCINPRLTIRFPGEPEAETEEAENELAKDKFPELKAHDFRVAGLEYFKDIAGALAEYKRRYEEGAAGRICHTAISQKVWAELDAARESRSMILIDGLEGRGKTEAVRAWCNCHLGLARFVTLDGTSTKTTQFREIARALGVGHGVSRKVSEMQAGVKEVLRISGLMLVIDEAHFFFNQGPRVYTRPEMLDWIDTAICNQGLPIALVTTPQFMQCMGRAAEQVGWNYRQFKRRCKRYLRLPENNSREDIEAVARWLMPDADAAMIKLAVGYEAICKRDLSAIGDVAREARLIAEKDAGEAKLKFEHVKQAIHGVLIASDVPWAEMERRVQQSKRAGLARRGGDAAQELGLEAPGASAPITPAVRPHDATEMAPRRPGGNRQPAPTGPPGRIALQEPVGAPD